jgi:hypothetical protein
MNFRTEIMKPMLLIATAIVAFGSIITRADAIDTKHLFGFTIGTDIGELGGKELERNTLLGLDKRTGSYSALGPKLDIFAATMGWVSTASGAVAFLLVQQYMPSCQSALGSCLPGMSRSRVDRRTIQSPWISGISSGIKQRSSSASPSELLPPYPGSSLLP